MLRIQFKHVEFRQNYIFSCSKTSFI